MAQKQALKELLIKFMILVGISVVLALFPLNWLVSEQFASLITNFFHPPVVFLWCLFIYQLLQMRFDGDFRKTTAAIASIATISISVGVEVIQPLFNRSFEVVDMIFNVSGVLIFWFYLIPYKNVRKVALLAVIGAITVVFAQHFMVYFKANSPIASKVAFTQNFEQWHNINGDHLRKLVKTDNALKGQSLNYQWSGVEMLVDRTADLTQFKQARLQYDAEVVGKPYKLFLRFTDASGNRIQHSVLVETNGKQELLYSLEQYQELDWSAITGVAVFYVTNQGPSEYLLHELNFS